MDATVNNTVNVATVVNAAGLTASVVGAAGENAVVSYTLPIAAVVSPNQSINLITVSGPQGPVGPAGSGVLNLTGQYPIFYDAGSGIVGVVSGYYATFSELTGTSGALVAQIQAAAAGVNSVNGISGFVTLAATNPLFVSVAGQTITISGSGLVTSGDLTRYYLSSNPQQYATSGNLSATGSYLYSLITGGTGAPANLSGYITTGQADLRYYPLMTNPSGYVTSGQTGQFASAAALQATGSYLYALITGNTGVANVSGYITTGEADVRYYPLPTNPSGYVTTGQTGQFYPTSNPQGYAPSGFVTGASGALQAQISALPTATQLAQTGSDLYRLITGESGQGVIDYATKIQLTQSGIDLTLYINGMGANLSGNLTQSGIQLMLRDSSISGVLQGYINSLAGGTGSITTNVVYTSGTQFISGTKYFIGSTYIDNLFVTGSQTIINTQDLYVADNWIVMNATGAARDSALFISTGFTGVAATGAVIGWDVPSNSWRFGLASQQTDLFTLPAIASGEAVDAANARITALSGFVTGTSGYLQGQIALTGQQAWAAANNNGINLSGQLNSLSGQAEGIYVHRTGSETISGNKTWNGNAFFMSGVGIGVQSLVADGTRLQVSGVSDNILLALQASQTAFNFSSTFYGPYGGYTNIIASQREELVGTMPLAIECDTLIFTPSNAGEAGRMVNKSFGWGTTTPQAPLHVTGLIRSDAGFMSGNSKLENILYPRSNPSGYALDSLVVHRTGNELVSGNKYFLNNIGVSGNSIAFTSGNLVQSGIANQPSIAFITTGWSPTYFSPSFWNKRFAAVLPLGNPIRGTEASVGATSIDITEILGDQKILTPSINSVAGTALSQPTFYRGSTVGSNGFLSVSRFSITSPSGDNPKGAYAEPSGSRIFVGLSNFGQHTVNLGLSSNMIGNIIGLNYMYASGGSFNTGIYMQNWAIYSSDSSSSTTLTTSMNFQTGFYQFAMYCPSFPNNSTVNWQLDDLIRGSGVAGSISSTLPLGGGEMTPSLSLYTSSGIKTIGNSILYCESN